MQALQQEHAGAAAAAQAAAAANRLRRVWWQSDAPVDGHAARPKRRDGVVGVLLVYLALQHFVANHHQAHVGRGFQSRLHLCHGTPAWAAGARALCRGKTASTLERPVGKLPGRQIGPIRLPQRRILGRVVHLAQRRVALLVQTADRDVMGIDELPDLAVGPGDNRIDAHEGWHVARRRSKAALLSCPQMLSLCTNTQGTATGSMVKLRIGA